MSSAMTFLPVLIAVAVAGSPAVGMAQGSPPAGQYKIHAVISACTAHGCQQQHWFLKSTAWCEKQADGWSPTMGTGKLSVICIK